MKSKTKNILSKILLVIVSLVVAGGAVAKIIAIAPLVELYKTIGLLEYLQVLGIAEIVFLALFLSPPTMKVGFLLLTAYFGGAMAVELSHGTFFVAPGIINVLVWITAYLRDRSIFISASVQSSVRTKTAIV